VDQLKAELLTTNQHSIELKYSRRVYMLIEKGTTVSVQKYTTCQNLSVALTKGPQQNYDKYGYQTRDFQKVF
jgi:hypothetical protein